MQRMSEERTEDRRGAGPVGLYLLLLIVSLAPLPFGSNRPLFASTLCAASGSLLLFWGAQVYASGATGFPISRLRTPLFLYGAACLWATVQTLSIPGFADPAWQVASDLLGEALPGRISVNVEATVSGLMRLISYAIVFWLAVQFTRSSERARFAVHAVVFIGSLYCFYGLIIFLAGNDRILVFQKWAYLDSLTSTFVNRNSFATFAGLSLICSLAVFLERLRPVLRSRAKPQRKFVALMEEVSYRSAWATASTLVILLALLLTGSRAGVFSTMMAVVVFVFLQLATSGVNRRWVLATVGGAVVMLVLVLVIAGNHLASRLMADEVSVSGGVRFHVYSKTVEMIQDAASTGTGLGTFPDVYPAHDTEPVSLLLFWDKAHNTYLENAAELGLPAAAALNLAIILLAFRTLSGSLTRRSNKDIPSIGFAASILVGLHSLVDFSLQIPAVAVFYAFILGTAIGQSWSRGRGAS